MLFIVGALLAGLGLVLLLAIQIGEVRNPHLTVNSFLRVLRRLSMATFIAGGAMVTISVLISY